MMHSVKSYDPKSYKMDISSDELLDNQTSSSAYERAVGPLLVLFAICFLVASMKAAAANPLWMDEVLTVWVVRLKSTGAIWSALYHGSEFASPTYHLLLHYWASVAGYSYLALRLPSILAILASGICVFALLRPRAGTSVAAFGMCLSLLGYLSTFAVQIRPYALVVCCFSMAAVLWSGLDDRRPSWWRIMLITGLLAFAIALHFYAVLFVPCFALTELIWAASSRRIRVPVWIALIVAGASSFAWLPLIRTISRYNAGDSSSYAYYAKPTSSVLRYVYATYFIFDIKQALLLLVSVCLVGVVYAFGHVYRPFGSDSMSKDRLRWSSMAKLYSIAFATTAFPVIVFIFARLVTRTFHARYALIACAGLALLTACALGSIPAFRQVIAFALLVACALTFIRSEQPGGATGTVALLKDATKPYPIVIAEGLQFFQLEEAAPEPLKSRLVYVTAPPGVTSGDPTNEHQVERWRPIRPDLKIEDANSFFAQNPHFYILHSEVSADILTDWLLRKDALGKPQGRDGDEWLFEGEAPALPESK